VERSRVGNGLYVVSGPSQCFGLGLFDEGVFAVHAGFDVGGMGGGEVLFEEAVGRSDVGVGAEVVAEGEVAGGVGGIFLEGVDLVGSGAGGIVAVEMAAAGNTEFAFDVVAELFEGGVAGVDEGDVCDDGEHIDDGLGVDAGDGGAADVVNGDEVVSECGGGLGVGGSECFGPFALEGDDDDAFVGFGGGSGILMRCGVHGVMVSD
jgi:hypothetical protein